MSTLKTKAQGILNEKNSKLTPRNLKWGTKVYDVISSCADKYGILDNSFYKCFAFGDTSRVYENIHMGRQSMISYSAMVEFNPNCPVDIQRIKDCVMINSDVDPLDYANGCNCSVHFYSSTNADDVYTYRFGISARNNLPSMHYLIEDKANANFAVVVAYPKSMYKSYIQELIIYIDEDIADIVLEDLMRDNCSNFNEVYNGAGFYLVEATYNADEDYEEYTMIEKITTKRDIPFNPYYAYNEYDDAYGQGISYFISGYDRNDNFEELEIEDERL